MNNSIGVRGVGLSGRTVVVVVALVALLGLGNMATVSGASGEGQADVATIAQDENETELNSFVAESQGGYIAFSEGTEAAAREDGTAFPALDDGETPIQIQAEVDGTTWESTETTFPDLAVTDDVTAEVEVIGTLEGEIDPEAGVFTSEGEFRVTIPEADDASFTYDSAQTVETSGELSGSADFDSDPAQVTLVDNEFTVDDETGDQFVDAALGLPADETGENWLELQLEINLDQEEVEDREDESDDEDEEDNSTQTLVLTVLGQAFGFVALGAGVLSMLVTLVARFTGVITLET